MIKLSIEEKARRYDEAKYIMKEYIESGNAGVIAENTIKKAFPELFESEDERIRKALLEMVYDTTGDSLWIDYNVHKEDALAWLEKQGKKPTDNIESSVQNKPWSEEDEEIYQREIDWLESLKPQSQWKPSEE